MTGDDGRELEPVFGAGLTGFKNLGNRCSDTVTYYY
jgi:ubiquitin carboxyl-terminal hydrolase 5/13